MPDKNASSAAPFKLRLKDLTSSLFIRLLLSFFIIIALLVTFIFYSVFNYRSGIKDEIIKYNTLGLQKTTEDYDKLLALIQSSILTFSLELQDASAASVDYVRAVSTMQKLQVLLSNRLLYLDNLILMHKKTGFALEQSRGADIGTMFERYYNSTAYGSSFWVEQFERPGTFEVLPAAAFAEVSGAARADERRLIPIVVRNDRMSDFYMIAMVRADAAYAALRQMTDDRFYILNEKGRTLYATVTDELKALPDMRGDSGHLIDKGVYYFYEKGANGLTYLLEVPDTTISGQIRWNFTFLALLALTVGISLIASLLFSVRINLPVKRMIESIHKWNAPIPGQSGIKEFNMIQDKIGEVLKTSRDIHADMTQKESLLRYYAYSNALKKIRHQHGSHTPIAAPDRPYSLLLFQLHFKPNLRRIEVDEDRAASFIREYVNRIVAELYPDSVTLQMENDQILSIVFAGPDDPDIASTLERIGHVLQAEQEYVYLTIAATGGAPDWNEAYRCGLDLLRARKFGEETQIVIEPPNGEEPGVWSPGQEEELETHLYQGNEALAQELARRAIGKLKKRSPSAAFVRQFAESIASRTLKVLRQRQIDPAPVREALEALHDSRTFEQLEASIGEFIREACLLVGSEKDKQDPTIAFVYDYIAKNFDKDITLDVLADKLNISRSYLSRYFKEKTGEYFVDYVNSVRIEEAKKLLLRPDIRIQDAAQIAGYQNINSFNRMFKKFTGFTPSEYRKQAIQ